MSAIDISHDLIDWANMGGWTAYFPEGEGRILFRTGLGGEFRFYLEKGADDWIRVTTSERGGDEKRFVDLASVEALAAFLAGYFGGSVREERGLPLLDIPFEASKLASGFAIVNPDVDGSATLVNSQGVPVAKSGTGDMGVGNLVEFSHYLSGSFEDLKSSFLSPGGKPLFSVL